MKLTPRQRQIVTEKLDSFGVDTLSCPVCRSAQWGISEMLTELRGFYGGWVTIGGPVIPLVTLNCLTCGNTLFLNAIALGVIDSKSGEPVGG